MKLHLSINSTPQAGYINIDPSDGGNGKIIADFRDLNNIVENSEATEILAPNVMDYIRSRDVASIIMHWITKLRKGGKILVGGTDPHEVANALVTGRINIIEFNQLLHGEQTSVWQYKYGCATVKDLVSLFKSAGVKILRTRTNLEDFTMFVEGVKE